MEAKTFKIAGGIIFATGFFVLLVMLNDFIQSIINNTVYSRYLSSNGDYWMWGYFIIPVLLILIGVYYFLIGVKEIKVNKQISASAVIQLIASIIGFIGFVIPLITRGEWDYIITLLLGIPTCILMLTGIILLIIGLILKKPYKKSRRS